MATLLRLWDMVRRVPHDLFGWHDGSGGDNSFDGCSVGGRCSRCGRRVLKDSQGNWFVVGD